MLTKKDIQGQAQGETWNLCSLAERNNWHVDFIIKTSFDTVKEKLTNRFSVVK